MVNMLSKINRGSKSMGRTARQCNKIYSDYKKKFKNQYKMFQSLCREILQIIIL